MSSSQPASGSPSTAPDPVKHPGPQAPSNNETPRAALCVIPSTLGVGEEFTVKVKLRGAIQKIPCAGAYNTPKPGLRGPFNLNVQRNIQYLDDTLPTWQGELRTATDAGWRGLIASSSMASIRASLAATPAPYARSADSGGPVRGSNSSDWSNPRAEWSSGQTRAGSAPSPQPSAFTGAIRTGIPFSAMASAVPRKCTRSPETRRSWILGALSDHVEGGSRTGSGST